MSSFPEFNDDGRRLRFRSRDLDFIRDSLKIGELKLGAAGHYDYLIGNFMLLYDDLGEVIVRVLDVAHYDTVDELLDDYGFKIISPASLNRSNFLKALRSIRAQHASVFSDRNVERKGGVNIILFRTIKT